MLLYADSVFFRENSTDPYSQQEFFVMKALFYCFLYDVSTLVFCYLSRENQGINHWIMIVQIVSQSTTLQMLNKFILL